MAEHEINLSGAVNPDQAIQVGQLTGAKVIVTGSVVQVESNLYLVAKIIDRYLFNIITDRCIIFFFHFYIFT